MSITNNTNQLKNVNDTGNANYGFKDGSELATEYTYDANGNILTDANKNITSVEYNHLNMPTKITVTGTNAGVLQYKYSADGVKLRKIKTQGVTSTTTDYANGYTYVNNELQYFPTLEGYVTKDNTGFKYVYQYKDHLGNVRLSYTDNNNDGIIQTGSNTEIIEESNYYPFGLKQKGYNGNIIGSENNYKTYLGQEINKDLGLNWLSFRYRNYNPEIGRFFGVDPVSEDYLSISTYQFAHNSPVWKIELEGLEGYPLTGTDNLNFEPIVGHTMLPNEPAVISTSSSTGGSNMVSVFGGESSGTYGTLRTGEFNDSDFGGIINPASDAMYNSDPAGALLQDVTFIALSFVGANAIDDAIATANDPNASTLDVAEATVNALSVGKGGKGKVNGNSKLSTKSQHGYEITNVTKGTRHKVGVSGSKLNKNGTSRRANSQVNKLNKKGGDKYKATVKTKNVKGRQNILNWEKKEVNQHYKKTGTIAPGQKRPKPDDI